MNKLFENPFIKKQDDFLKSPAEAPLHRKVLLEVKGPFGSFPFMAVKIIKKLFRKSDEF